MTEHRDTLPISRSASPGGQRWRSFEEWSGEPEVLAAIDREFSPGAGWWLDEPSRRQFLQRMGASFALAGLVGCVQEPDEKIVPYVRTPEGMTPGEARFFATAMPQPGGAIGVLAKSHEGRPTKIEGNPEHPSSLGASDAFAQASVLSLYDPLRSSVVREQGRIASWPDFLAAVQMPLDSHRSRRGAGLHLLTGRVWSPTLLDQIRELLDEYPEARWTEYEPGVSGIAEQAALQFLGQDGTPSYRLRDVDVIFSVGADFLGDNAAHVRLSAEFAPRRVPSDGRQPRMSRLYVAETSPSVTGSAADHWLTLSSSEMTALLSAVAQRLGVQATSQGTAEASPRQAELEAWAYAVADDLRQAGDKALVIAGDAQPLEHHLLALQINQQLGAIGKSLVFYPAFRRAGNHSPGTLQDLTTAMDAGAVKTLVVLGQDLVYSAPADLKIRDLLSKVSLTIHSGLHVDATSQACVWHVPSTHYLEEWSDTRAEDGTISLIQPLIAPLFQGKSFHEVLNVILGRSNQSGHDTVRAYWASRLTDQFGWERSLHDGLVASSAAAPLNVVSGAAKAVTLGNTEPAVSGSDFEVFFRTDPSIFDGRYATNGWLQEAPRPLTKITWKNGAWIGPKSATALGLKNGDVVELQNDLGKIQIPVWIQPGQPAGTLTLFLGGGRQIEGFDAVGVDVGLLRSSGSPWRTVVKLASTGQREVLATTQHHFMMDGRDIIRVETLDGGRVEFGHGHGHHPQSDATLYPDWPRTSPQWGMSINLTACTGCNACVIACQSENNIPVVGADQVARGREMHWLRIDTYYEGEPDSPQAFHQPVMCMHCEHAPCEPVCPVAATTHSDEGLNEMTYNRCVGTRYCSNNCPYKVRRFNFLEFNSDARKFPTLALLQNPEVTVRSRGVMEKCTYCVQRISAARIDAKMDGRPIQDGEVVTACQSACPARAITFGDITDPKSEVSLQKQNPSNYGLLADLNTRPRTTYTPVMRNPNPALAQQHHGEHA